MAEEMMAGQPSLRAALRSDTSPVHQRLDDMVGTFETADQYRSFVLASYRFRLAVEAACAGHRAWHLLPLLPSLGQDLEDLGLKGHAGGVEPLRLEGQGEKLGGLYVLEGSALGARLLMKRAESLGFTKDFGARHLARQTADNGRWKSFVALLDGQGDDRQDAISGAQKIFDAAIAIYSEEVLAHV